jgi:hypothetical protein
MDGGQIGLALEQSIYAVFATTSVLLAPTAWLDLAPSRA